MTYNEAIEYLYAATPQFQSIGAAAYKPGLDTVRTLAAQFGNPQKRYPIVHVAGTNGKGSTSHTIAAVLQSSGYKVGLYTSPHLVDFRERMRVNGAMIPRAEVVDFLERYRAIGEESAVAALFPSFFELTTVMAFEWFAREGVDVAVIEVGLGGRLDSTNIVDSTLSVITNISPDHMAQLGNTLESIAREKAGIMREGVPVICGETKPAIKEFFADAAREAHTSIQFAQDEFPEVKFASEGDFMAIDHTPFGPLRYQLTGSYQRENAFTVLASLLQLRALGWKLSDEAVRRGFAEVCTLTGLMGRWMRIAQSPLTICDTGHNIGGWEHLRSQIASLPRPLVVVLGFVNDKDTSHIFPLLPADAQLIFTNANIPRALPAADLASRAAQAGLSGEVVPSVAEAYRRARELNPAAVFVGGSTFVVADLLASLQTPKEECVK